MYELLSQKIGHGPLSSLFHVSISLSLSPGSSCRPYMLCMIVLWPQDTLQWLSRSSSYSESELWYFDVVCIFATSASTYSIIWRRYHSFTLLPCTSTHHIIISWCMYVPRRIVLTACSALIVFCFETSCRSFIIYYLLSWHHSYRRLPLVSPTKIPNHRPT